MAYHPRERRSGQIDRRTFLVRSAALATFAAGGGSALLAACGGDDGGSSSGASASPVKLSRPDDPATLPLFDDVPAIKDGLKPESGTLKLYNYAEYINPDTIAAFEDAIRREGRDHDVHDDGRGRREAAHRQHEVRRVLPDARRDRQGRRRQAAPADQPDVHHELRATCGRRCRTPSTTRALSTPSRTRSTRPASRTGPTGSTTPPAELSNGYDILWDPAYKGRVYILNDDREALGMALHPQRRHGRQHRRPGAASQKALADLTELASTRST